LLNQLSLDEINLAFFIYAMTDNFKAYKGTINGLYHRAKDDLWTPKLATVVLLLGGILIITIFFNIAFFSFGGWFVSFIVYFIEALAPLILLFLHQRKVYETVREKALEMEATNPGIYEAYEEWRAMVDSPNS
jgi:hypothetical protein